MKLNFIIGMLGILIGGIITWIIAHFYYKKSNVDIPEWAKPLMKKLLKIAPNKEELISLFQDMINDGLIEPHSVFKHVACPNCKSPLENMKYRVVGDNLHDGLIMECPKCGYSEFADL